MPWCWLAGWCVRVMRVAGLVDPHHVWLVVGGGWLVYHCGGGGRCWAVLLVCTVVMTGLSGMLGSTTRTPTQGLGAGTWQLHA